MINLSYEDYLYFPTLRTRQAEMRGLLELDADRKRRLLPLLTLGRWPRAIDFNRSAEKANEAMNDLPHFLDLTRDASHLGEQQQKLRDPANSFKAWREFTAAYSNAIPVVQLVSGSKLRDQVKQATLIEKSIGKVAFRIQDFTADTQIVINSISALDDPKNAIVFIDCQYIRSALTAYVTATIATINTLRTEFPELMIVVLSTSFPSSVIPFADSSQQRGTIDIQERDLHSRIGGDAVAAYGDHGSIHSVVRPETTIMTWSARVDYPRETSWSFERRPGNQSDAGFSSAAADIAKTDPKMGTRGIWGEDKILEAAQGNPFARGPASWIAVRVNIHLARQLDFSTQLASNPVESITDGESEADDFFEE